MLMLQKHTIKGLILLELNPINRYPVDNFNLMVYKDASRIKKGTFNRATQSRYFS